MLAAWALGFTCLAVYMQRRRKNEKSRQQIMHASNEPSASRRSRFRNQERPALYVVDASREFRACMPNVIKHTDTVLEVGSQLASVTSIISQSCGRVIAVDIHRKPPSAHMKSGQFYRQHSDPLANGLRNVKFTQVDVSDVHDVTCCCAENDVDVIVVDAHVFFGHDLTFEVLSLLTALCNLLRPRVCIVKSAALTKLSTQLRPYPASAGGGFPGTPLAKEVTVLAAEWVHDYREAALSALEQLGSAATMALEIGCHVGATTALLHEKLTTTSSAGAHDPAASATASGWCGCVGVDVSASITERAKKLHPEVPFHVADAFDVQSLRRACPEAIGSPYDFQPQVILIDVGGLSGASGTLDALSLIKIVCAAFQPQLRVVVIKSSCARALATSLRSGKALCRSKHMKRPSR